MKFLAARPSTSTRAVVAAGTAGLLVVGVVGVVLVRNGESGPEVTDASRVLQSVSATVGSDGTITALDGTVVAIDSDGRSSTTETEYSPEEMARELPVRVSTSYRTDTGSGTDLDDLEGHDGRVEVALTVENLTVEPQELTYDVAGTQRTRSALVGVPLSVVASVGLGDLDPGTVVTESAEGSEATNGVLSRTESGETQVQWATILAPPQLGTTATLRLVVDTDDFSAPDVDLSVQQGLVTDPSLGALVDAAFNPASSEELKLQQRTISLIGEVNTVIARAGDSISDVRRTLRTSAETIGEQTVTDLQASTRSIAQSMTALGQAVDTLGQDLSSTLESTGSTAVQQLQASVAGLDSLLGDTSQQVPAAQTTGTGCETTVAPARRNATLYGSLVDVSSQLAGFAGATQQCKAAVQQRLIETIGTATQDADCPELAPDQEAASVTCTLFEVARDFGAVGDTFLNKYEDARDILLELREIDAPEPMSALNVAVDALSAAASTADTRVVGVLGEQLGDVRLTAASLRSEIDAIHDVAEAGRQLAAVDMAAKVGALRAQVCALTDPSRDALSAQLTGQDCNGGAVPGVAPLSSDIQAQVTSWQQVAGATDLDDGGAAVTTRLDALDAAVDRFEDSLDQGYTDSAGTDFPGVRELLADVVAATDDIDDARDTLLERVVQIQTGIGGEAVPAVVDDPATPQDETAPAQPGVGALGIIQRAFEDAQQSVDGRIDDAVAAQSARLVQQTAQDAADIGTAFERSAQGLAGAGERVRAEGKATIDEQRAKIAASKGKAEQALTRSVQAGLDRIEQGVDGSTRDTEAASTLLQADLRNVLIDLGTRDVDGSGLLGSMAASAATAATANVTLADATDTTTSFAGVRDSSIGGLYLRQAQADAAFARQAEQPAFGLDLPSSAQHRTVYNFHVRPGS